MRGEGGEWARDDDGEAGGDDDAVGKLGGVRGGGCDGGGGVLCAMGGWGSSQTVADKTGSSSSIIRFAKESLHCIPEGGEEDWRSSVGSAEVNETQQDSPSPAPPPPPPPQKAAEVSDRYGERALQNPKEP